MQWRQEKKRKKQPENTAKAQPSHPSKAVSFQQTHLANLEGCRPWIESHRKYLIVPHGAFSQLKFACVTVCLRLFAVTCRPIWWQHSPSGCPDWLWWPRPLPSLSCCPSSTTWFAATRLAGSSFTSPAQWMVSPVDPPEEGASCKNLLNLT